MKYGIRLLAFLLFVSACISLIYQSGESNRLSEEVTRLEAELGRMSIRNVDRVHLVEIAEPDIPPEIASHVERVWQFRCYLPPAYDFIQRSGGGRVTKEGVFQGGGYSSHWSSPKPEAMHKLLTISFQKKGNSLQLFYSFGGSSGTTSWSQFKLDDFDALVIQKLVSSEKGARSFDRDAILPLLKIYDPNTVADEKIAGKNLTTYAGGLFVICPKARETVFDKLRIGETPMEYDQRWLATEVGNE